MNLLIYVLMFVAVFIFMAIKRRASKEEVITPTSVSLVRCDCGEVFERTFIEFEYIGKQFEGICPSSMRIVQQTIIGIYCEVEPWADEKTRKLYEPWYTQDQIRQHKRLDKK